MNIKATIEGTPPSRALMYLYLKTFSGSNMPASALRIHSNYISYCPDYPFSFSFFHSHGKEKKITVIICSYCFFNILQFGKPKFLSLFKEIALLFLILHCCNVSKYSHCLLHNSFSYYYTSLQNNC